MFISQKKLEELIDVRTRAMLDEKISVYFFRRDLFKKGFLNILNEIQGEIASIEDYLDIHYEEEEFRGYVKNKKK